jgi:uncharacterized protein
VTHRATRLAAAALAVAAVTCIPSVPAVTAAAGTAAGRLCTETFIPMSDGVRLHAWVSRQAPDQPRPVLFMMDSYSRSGQGNGTTGSADDSCPQALPDDYVPQWLSASVISQFTLVQVAYRGTGLSEGLFDMSGPRTQQDVEASINWAASQPWSDGKVVLTGESGAGFAAFFGLRNPPRHGGAHLHQLRGHVPLLLPGRRVQQPGRRVPRGHPERLAPATAETHPARHG